MIVADKELTVTFELMVPLSNRFGVVFLELVEGIVQHLVLFLFLINYMAANHASIFEVGRLYHGYFFVQRGVH